MHFDRLSSLCDMTLEVVEGWVIFCAESKSFRPLTYIFWRCVPSSGANVALHLAVSNLGMAGASLPDTLAGKVI